MKQTLLTLVTTLVFAGACAYLLQKVRKLEGKLVLVRQMTLQRAEVGEVHKIAQTIIKQREHQLKLETAQQLEAQRQQLEVQRQRQAQTQKHQQQQQQQSQESTAQ